MSACGRPQASAVARWPLSLLACAHGRQQDQQGGDEEAYIAVAAATGDSGNGIGGNNDEQRWRQRRACRLR